MPLPEDRETRLRCFRNALRNWNFTGYVQFKPLAEEWLEKQSLGVTPREVARELCQHVETGGDIDEQNERRPEYTDFEFHCDLRVMIGKRRIYFEAVLLCELRLFFTSEDNHQLLRQRLAPDPAPPSRRASVA